MFRISRVAFIVSAITFKSPLVSTANFSVSFPDAIFSSILPTSRTGWLIAVIISFMLSTIFFQHPDILAALALSFKLPSVPAILAVFEISLASPSTISAMALYESTISA